MKKILSLMLTILLSISLFPAVAFADIEEGNGSKTASQLLENTDGDAIQVTGSKAETENGERISLNTASKMLASAEADPVDLPTGRVIQDTIKANTTVVYKISNISGYYSSYNVFVENLNSNNDEELSMVVTDSSRSPMIPLTEEAAYYDGLDTLSSGESKFTINGGYFQDQFYKLSVGDYIVLSAGDNDINYNLVVQELSCQNNYFGDFSELDFSADAILVPINPADSYQYNMVLYLENRYFSDFGFMILGNDDELLQSKEGYYCYWLKKDYHIYAGYNLQKDRDYYLLISIMPNDEYYNSSDFYYTETAYDEDEPDDYYYDEDEGLYYYYDEYDDEYYYCDEDFEPPYHDFVLTTTPQNIRYMDVENLKSKTYTGKALKQNPDLVYYDVVIGGTSFTITYSNNKNVGTAKMTIKGVAPYTGTVSKSFAINPIGTSISKVRPAKKGFTVKWKKQSAKMSSSRITGYEIQYSTSSKFKSDNKTITVKGYSKTSKKIKKLKSKKKYYVRIRTYKTVGGKKYYSAWSKAKAVKTK